MIGILCPSCRGKSQGITGFTQEGELKKQSWPFIKRRKKTIIMLRSLLHTAVAGINMEL